MIVRYSRRVLTHLNQVRAYIAHDNPWAADAVIIRIRDAIDGLRQFPSRGRPGCVTGTRELVVPNTPFVVPYRVLGREVHILAVIHGRRAWPSDESET